MKDFVTFSQVCERYGKTSSQVRYAIRQGRLKATKIGWQWCFMVEELPEKWPETTQTVERLRRGKPSE